MRSEREDDWVKVKISYIIVVSKPDEREGEEVTVSRFKCGCSAFSKEKNSHPIYT
jgi:hypothetical protein